MTDVLLTDGRALATIATIDEIAEIPDADQIVRARVRGWDVVVKRDEFAVGDKALYIEVDALLDVTDPRFEFLAGKGIRTTVDGVTGHVLKTIRLRGQYSQGLALPYRLFVDELGDRPVGDDVTDVLGIVKWDPPVPANLAGEARGFRPSWIPKTDEERVQNFPAILEHQDLRWVATEKLDGSSCSFFVDQLEYDKGVCSRNLNLVDTPGNTLWRLATELHIFDRMRMWGIGDRLVVQGEAFGEGIQGNPLKLKGQQFRAFSLRVDGVDVPRSQWPTDLLDIAVPVHDLTFPRSVDEALAQVDGLRSAIADRPAEGIVWRVQDRTHLDIDGRLERASVKVVSNRYLLKHDR